MVQFKQLTAEEIEEIAGLVTKYAIGSIGLGELDKRLRQRMVGYTAHSKVLQAALLFADGIIEDAEYRSMLKRAGS